MLEGKNHTSDIICCLLKANDHLWIMDVYFKVFLLEETKVTDHSVGDIIDITTFEHWDTPHKSEKKALNWVTKTFPQKTGLEFAIIKIYKR